MMPRLLMLCRVVLGVLLIRQGAIGLSDLVRLAGRLDELNAWQAWPLVGSLRPMELAIWLGASQFAIGIFLVGGLLTRFMAFGAALLALFSVLAFWGLGLGANLAHGALLAAALLIAFKGGGAGTMDKLLGRMQKLTIEREAAREAERRAAAQQAAERDQAASSAADARAGRLNAQQAAAERDRAASGS
jgi:uncharacterized membrane protein YphA (DoxX/SURF4 family)